jgi:DNA polymerase III delta subunit
MLRLNPSALVQKLIQETPKSCLHLLLSDNPIFQRIIEGRVEKQEGSRPKLFQGNTAIEDFVHNAATPDMFSTPRTSVLVLPEKFSAKNWTEAKKQLARLPQNLEAPAFIIGGTKLKNLFKETDFSKQTPQYLCYEPNDIDLEKCLQLLLGLYPHVCQGRNQEEKNHLVHALLESYTQDLVSCDLHLERMEKSGLSFSAALSGSPDVNGFHVAEALALRDKHLVEHRLHQCALSGEEASSVFMAIVYFLKQATFVLGALEQTQNIKSAFELVHIPYPAQARLQKALSWMKAHHLESFFAQAHRVEMEMRLQKQGHAYLSAFLLDWMSAP